jgi:alpha-L-fucosidase
MEAMIRRHQPDIVINPRYNVWGGHCDIGQYRGFENHFPKTRPSEPWELCISIRGGWGCNNPKNPHAGRPTVWVLSELAKCRSWGGNYLPNIGPWPDGTMPSYYYGLCEELTGWMKHSREAVEDVDGGPWPERSNVPVTTRNDGTTWYLFAWPQTDKLEFDEECVRDKLKYQDPHRYVYKPRAKTIVAADVKRPRRAVLLRSGEELKFDYGDGTLTITIPAEQTTRLVDVVRVSW